MLSSVSWSCVRERDEGESSYVIWFAAPGSSRSGTVMLRSHVQRAASSIGVSSAAAGLLRRALLRSSSGLLNPGAPTRGSFVVCLFQQGVLPMGLPLSTFLGIGWVLS